MASPRDRGPPRYRRRRPEQGLLHRILREHLATFLARFESPDGRGLPRFVRRELLRYLACGVLAFGFARVHCSHCRRDDLVAFSCKGRGFCPSCGARRMSDTAAHLVEDVLPHFPVRQWVLSFPHRVRWLLAYHPRLCVAVRRISVRVVLGWLEERAEREGAQADQPPLGAPPRPHRGPKPRPTPLQRASNHTQSPYPGQSHALRSPIRRPEGPVATTQSAFRPLSRRPGRGPLALVFPMLMLPITDADGNVYSGSWHGPMTRLSPDGDVAWTSAGIGLQRTLAVSHAHRLALYGGETFGQPNWFGLVDQDTGEALWEVPFETIGGHNELIWSNEAGFSPDGDVAYVTTRFTSNGAPGRLWAIRLSPDSGPEPDPADLDGSGSVGFADVVVLLSAWGPCPDCAADLDGDGSVGLVDLLQVLAAWTE